MTNYIFYENYSLFCNAFMYIDTEDYFSYQIFSKHKIKVDFLKCGNLEGIPYKVIFCKVKKRDAEKFIKAIAELENKIIIMGYSNYPQHCADLFAQMGYPTDK